MKQETWWRRSTSTTQSAIPSDARKGEKQPNLSLLFFFFLKSCSCINVTHKLNFPLHCAILSTKVQQLRNKNHRLEEGYCIWQGGTNFGSQKLSGGTNFGSQKWSGGTTFGCKKWFPDHFLVGLLLVWQLLKISNLSGPSSLIRVHILWSVAHSHGFLEQVLTRYWSKRVWEVRGPGDGVRHASVLCKHWDTHLGLGVPLCVWCVCVEGGGVIGENIALTHAAQQLQEISNDCLHLKHYQWNNSGQDITTSGQDITTSGQDITTSGQGIRTLHVC